MEGVIGMSMGMVMELAKGSSRAGYMCSCDETVNGKPHELSWRRDPVFGSCVSKVINAVGASVKPT